MLSNVSEPCATGFCFFGIPWSPVFSLVKPYVVDRAIRDRYAGKLKMPSLCGRHPAWKVHAATRAHPTVSAGEIQIQA
jgi:hypothetical protein